MYSENEKKMWKMQIFDGAIILLAFVCIVLLNQSDRIKEVYVCSESSTNCYELDGVFSGGNLKKIFFPKGGWVTIEDGSCDRDYCNVTDTDGGRWEYYQNNNFGTRLLDSFVVIIFFIGVFWLIDGISNYKKHSNLPVEDQ